MIRIKICGVTCPEDADAVARSGADAIGLNFFSRSPRFIEPLQAGHLIRRLDPFLTPVGVFVGAPMRQACAIAFQLGLRGIQILAEERDSGDAFPFALLAAYRVKDAATLDMIRQDVAAAQSAGRPLGAVLVDAHVPGQAGGTGQKAPWDLLAGFDPGVPMILAGGLTPENVAEAISRVKPWGVDVASGVELSPGVKDHGKIAAFVANARQAAAALK